MIRQSVSVHGLVRRRHKSHLGYVPIGLIKGPALPFTILSQILRQKYAGYDGRAEL